MSKFNKERANNKVSSGPGAAEDIGPFNNNDLSHMANQQQQPNKQGGGISGGARKNPFN